MTGVNGNLNNTANLTILFIDSNSIHVARNKINSNIKVISFDYESHKALSEKNIQHSMSDEYTNEEKLLKIQNLTYKLTEWYSEDEVKKYLEYNGLNLGKLFYDELLYELLKIIKKFFEVREIFQLYPNANYVAPNLLYDTLCLFTKSVTKIHNKEKLHIFGTERIRLNFKVGNKHFVFYISRSSYLKIKNVFEKLVHTFLCHKKNNNPNLLLVEFHTTRYKDLLFTSKKFPINIMFYGRRRPAFWNRESFFIIKKSKCSIITPSSLIYSSLKEHVKRESEQVLMKLKSMWDNEEFFNVFFSINTISFWSILKPILTPLLEKRINETIYEIKIAEQMFGRYDFSTVIVLSEIGFIEQIVINQAKKSKVPVILFQEGYHWDTKEANQMNRSQGMYPINTDILLAWSKIDEKDAITNAGILPHKIKVLGSPRYDTIVNQKNNQQEEYILLATIGPQPEDIHGLVVPNIIEYEQSIFEICTIVNNLGKKLIVKLHPSPDELDVTSLIKKINPKIIVIAGGDILPLIQSCSIMIVLHLSTAIIEAQILQKPIICVPTIDYKWGHPEIFKSNACVLTTVKDLEQNIQRILNDEFKTNLLENEKSFLEKNFVNLGTASYKIFEFIATIKKNSPLGLS